MAGLGSKVNALLSRAVGSIRNEAERIRAAGDKPNGQDIAQALNGIQGQIDAIVKVLQQNPTLQELVVQDSTGTLIGWVGDRIVNAVTYMGAWFRQLYIGGTSAATAKIVADANGDVTINGATITLNANGVTTTINNVDTPPFGVLSLKSLDNASGFFSGIQPFGLQLVDGSGNNVGYFLSGGAAGHMFLGNAAGTKTCLLITGGGGSPKLTIADSATITVSYSPTAPVSVAGTTAIDSSRNGDFNNLAINGTAGINASDTLLTAVTPALASVVNSVGTSISAFITGVSVSTTTIGYTPGASSATFVSGVGSSSSTAVVGVSAGTISAVTGITPTTQTNGYTKGLRTT